ncbi:hypothetical protein ABIB30_001736 [Pedobacter sp. UYP1]
MFKILFDDPITNSQPDQSFHQKEQESPYADSSNPF